MVELAKDAVIVVVKHQVRRAVQAVQGRPVASEYGLSAADVSAIAIAQQIAVATGTKLYACTVGDESTETTLRDAAEFEVDGLIRIPAPEVGPVVRADLIAQLAFQLSARYIVTGDYSTEFGSGSTPLHLAQRMDWTLVSSVIAVESSEGTPVGSLWLKRRCFGSYIEVAEITGPALISVEPTNFRPKRSSLGSAIEATRPSNAMTIFHASSVINESGPISTAAQRFYATYTSAPTGVLEREKLSSILKLDTTSATPMVVELSPEVAARLILDTLIEWELIGIGDEP